MRSVRWTVIGIVALLVSTRARAQLPRGQVSDLDTVRFATTLGVDLGRAVRTPGGAYVREVRPGSGTRANFGQTITVRFRAWLPTGAPIGGDSAQQFTFRLGAGTAMPGVEEGVTGMRVGGRRQLVVPAQAQGRAGVLGAPLGSPVVFDLIRVATR